jgi:hypothetical protein
MQYRRRAVTRARAPARQRARAVRRCLRTAMASAATQRPQRPAAYAARHLSGALGGGRRCSGLAARPLPRCGQWRVARASCAWPGMNAAGALAAFYCGTLVAVLPPFASPMQHARPRPLKFTGANVVGRDPPPDGPTREQRLEEWAGTLGVAGPLHGECPWAGRPLCPRKQRGASAAEQQVLGSPAPARPSGPPQPCWPTCTCSPSLGSPPPPSGAPGIFLQDGTISSAHALISLEAGAICRIKDLGSTNKVGPAEGANSKCLVAAALWPPGVLWKQALGFAARPAFVTKCRGLPPDTAPIPRLPSPDVHRALGRQASAEAGGQLHLQQRRGAAGAALEMPWAAGGTQSHTHKA